MTAATAVLASLALVSAALPLKPELEIRRPDPNARFAKPGYKAATEAQYAALKDYLDAEGVAYREIGPNETPQSRFVLNVNEKEVQEKNGIGAYGKTAEAFVRDIRRRIARDTPTAVASSAGADELQRLADAAVAEPGRTLVLEKGRTYRLTRPLRLDARHSGLTIEGNGAIVEAGREVSGWRTEGGLLVADVADWDGDILSLWVNGRRAQLAQAPNGDRARMKTMPPKPLSRPYVFDSKKDGVAVAAKDVAGVLASSDEELKEAFVDYTIAWFTPKCRLVQAYDNGDGTANVLARNVACLHGTAGPARRYVPFNFGPYEKAWSGETGLVVSNLRRLLDAPGEFFFDRKTKKLLYCPREGETAENVTAHFATLERALEIVGDAPAKRVRNVTVRNAVFRHGRQDRNSPDGFAPASQAAAKCGGFLWVENAEGVRLEGLCVEHCDVYGVAFAGGTWDSALVGSKLIDCGSGGVRVGVDYTVIPDGDDRGDPRQSGYVSIVGNEIRGYGRWNRSGCGVILFDVGNCCVEENDVSDGFYSGISVGWTWNAPKAHTQNNRIVRNRIRNLGQGVTDDLAGIYVLGGESYGSVIAENDVRDISRFNYGGWGIYLDSRAGHYLVESNRCENCDDGGFFKNQGVRNIVRGNTFLYGRYTQIGDEPADDDDILFENNVIVYRRPAVVFRDHIPRITRGVWRNNTYQCENGSVTFGPQEYTLEDLQRLGLEEGSAVIENTP